MIGGQYRDVRPDEALDASGLERTSRLKTGALLGASAACGAIVAGAGEGGIDTARAFGVELGLLFQIVDDVLDETGSDEALGKSGAADARRGRRTFASELGPARATAPPRASAPPRSSSRRDCGATARGLLAARGWLSRLRPTRVVRDRERSARRRWGRTSSRAVDARPVAAGRRASRSWFERDGAARSCRKRRAAGAVARRTGHPCPTMTA